jgi:hypothetical protein
MQRAVDLVKLYVPPSSEKIQAVKDTGNASLGRRAGSALLTIDVDPKSNRLLGATVRKAG